MVPDEPTLGEIARRLEAVHADLKEDLREHGHRLDRKVSLERYQLERQADNAAVQLLSEEVRVLKEERAAEARKRDEERRKREEQRRADRRLMVTAIIGPMLVVLWQVYLTTKGAGA